MPLTSNLYGLINTMKGAVGGGCVLVFGHMPWINRVFIRSSQNEMTRPTLGYEMPQFVLVNKHRHGGTGNTVAHHLIGSHI